MTAEENAKMIDVSVMRADSTLAEIRQSAELAMQLGCVAEFALPPHTPYLIDLLAGSTVFAGGTVGFPSGGETTAIKSAITAELIHMGCREIDMVNNLTWLKARNKALYVQDVRAVVKAASGRPVKVILECHWLTEAEIVRACEWCVEAGAAWVKTGTGWAPTGATLENVALITQTVGARCQVKAAGGVRDLATLLAMYDRGVRRFGIGVRTAQAILKAAVEKKPARITQVDANPPLNNEY